MRKLLILTLILPILAVAQYDPAGGELGSLSIERDHSAIYQWADSAMAEIGWMDIADTSIGRANSGLAGNAVGSADGMVVSLGDKGVITLVFNEAIKDLQGYDLAVFENGFRAGEGYFLELAFVEVSSDGVHFTRFPAYSSADTLTQLSNADVQQPTTYKNLAGKHQYGFGTLFDLEEIGADSIHYIRLIDVCGSIDPQLGSRGADSVLINDPYPTAFPSGGFDLDAVAAVRGQFIHVEEEILAGLSLQTLFPSGNVQFDLPPEVELEYIMDQEGKLLDQNEANKLTAGTYYLQLSLNGVAGYHRICVY